MSRFFYVSLGCTLLVSMASAACTEHTIVHAKPTDVVTIENSCVQTSCSANNERRSEDCSRCQNECYDLVLEGCDPSSVCQPTCTPAEPCTDDAADTKCEKTKWTAHVSLHATPGVEAACQTAYADFWTKCGGHPTDEDVTRRNVECANAALFDSEAGAAYYACLGASACGAPADCEQPSTLGDEVCAMRGASCSEAPCDEASRAGLNDIGSHLKPAMLAAAKTCVNQVSCDDVGACMREWWKLIEE